MKYTPIRICSCRTCRHSDSRRFYFKVANKKFRQGNKQVLKAIALNLSEEDKLDAIANVAGGYTD